MLENVASILIGGGIIMFVSAVLQWLFARPVQLPPTFQYIERLDARGPYQTLIVVDERGRVLRRIER